MAEITSGSKAVASTAAIRPLFPALERRHGGSPVAYFDGPGGTQVPRAVVVAMQDYLYNHNANTGWAYPTSMETDAALWDARQALADFFGCMPEEVVFGANMTTLVFHLARALGRRFEPGDEIVVTELDHHANVDPWRDLARERGLAVRTARLQPETGQLDMDHWAAQLGARTRLVAIGAASNALGSIQDVALMARLAHAVGALVCVDAVHFAPHGLIDVGAIDCDFLACSPYKFYGPHLGALFVKRDLLQGLDFPKVLPAPDSAPDRAETGTLNHEGIVGAGAAVDFLADLAPGNGTRRDRLRATFAALHERGAALVRRLWDGLASIDAVTLYGPPPSAPRTPTVSFTLRGHPSKTVAQQLAARAVFVSHGDFYAATTVERLGLSREGLVRAGCACYTTSEEVDRFVAAVQKLEPTSH